MTLDELRPAPSSWVTCPRCDQAMTPGTSCCDCSWTIDGREIPATRFGSEPYFSTSSPDGVCRDCNTPIGGTHHYGCCVERCPHGNQAIECEECPVLEHDPYFQPRRADA